MQKTLDRLAITLCENLPLDFTLYEQNGFCHKPNENCDYCRKDGNTASLCNKKTYTAIQEPREV